MTHIRGDISKIKEITKDAFTEPVGAGTPKQLFFAYSITPGTSPFDDLFTGNYAVETGHQVMLRYFNISCSNTAVNNILFTYADGTIIADFYFRYDRVLEFSLGDLILTKEEADGFIMYITNNGAAANFYGTINYIDIPPET